MLGTYAMTITTTFTRRDLDYSYLLPNSPTAYYLPPTARLPCQVLGTNAMIMTDNNYPNTAKV